MRHLAIVAAALFLTAAVAPRAQPQDRAVVLITLDGARWQEMFGGLDVDVLRSTLKPDQAVEQQPLYKQYWASTPGERRRVLLPFFWGTLMREHGSIAGNQAAGSRVQLTNQHWFSYPGYSEILVGRADDAAIKSNDPIRNPHRTVLEFLRERAKLTREQVAAFASWEIFREIVSRQDGAITVNAGYQAYDSPDAEVRRQSAQQFKTPTPWDSVRHDDYTFAFAMDHLTRHRPRVLYLAFGETDDWAHDGRYDRVLQAYTRPDQYLQALWTWLQAQPAYRGRTSLLITTDHGRGSGTNDWRDHGKDVRGAGDTWMAFVSPGMTRRGEWRDHPPITANQVAATLIEWMGFNPAEFSGAAPPVKVF